MPLQPTLTGVADADVTASILPELPSLARLDLMTSRTVTDTCGELSLVSAGAGGDADDDVIATHERHLLSSLLERSIATPLKTQYVFLHVFPVSTISQQQGVHVANKQNLFAQSDHSYIKQGTSL